MMVAVALAGCADDTPETAPVDSVPTTTQGIIQGLLVDDRFRPLTVPGTLESGILIQETGDLMETNENGEFQSLPLDPGTYTLRATVPDHEASPETFQVRAGEATDASIIARRIVSTEDLLIQREFTVFMPCMVGAVASPVGACAVMDLSGDSTRYVFRMNITEYTGAHFMINELLLNKDAGSMRDGTFLMQMEGPNPDPLSAQSYNFVGKFIDDGHYDKTIVEKNFQDESLQQDPSLNYGFWNDDMDWIGWRFWGSGLLRNELNDAGVPAPHGVGPQLAIKAKVLTTILFTENRDVAEGSCWFCEDPVYAGA